MADRSASRTQNRVKARIDFARKRRQLGPASLNRTLPCNFTTRVIIRITAGLLLASFPLYIIKMSAFPPLSRQWWSERNWSQWPWKFQAGRPCRSPGRKGKRKKGVSDEKQVWKEDRRRRKESEEARGIENGNRGVLVGRRVSVY